jgi:hypothetical protein
MSPSAPAGEPAGRPEKVTAFVSRAGAEQRTATPPIDDLNSFSSERSLAIDTRAAALDKPVPPVRTLSPAIIRWLLAGSALVGAIAAGILFLPALANLTPSSGPALKPGRVTIGTTPLGAAVSIDGQEYGLTPVTVQLNPGSHTAVLRRNGIERTMPLQVASGAELTQHYEFAPEAATGLSSISITTDPPGARVTVDGEAKGTSPLTVTGLTAASYRITVAGDNGSVERQVVTEAGVASSLVVSLPKAPAMSAGWLAVSSPFEVQVIERGDVIGTSASPRFMIPAGTHEADFVNESLGFSEHRRIEISQGATARISIDARAPISANARPWADVLLDGRPIGQTPIANLSVTLGTHQLVFRHPDLGERQQTMVVTAKGPNRIAVDLTR